MTASTGNPTTTDGRFERPTLKDRAALGKAAREQAPRSAHGEWAPAADRPDPVAMLEEQGATRVPELVPIRYGRMPSPRSPSTAAPPT